jgi:hypothetical protein
MKKTMFSVMFICVCILFIACVYEPDYNDALSTKQKDSFDFKVVGEWMWYDGFYQFRYEVENYSKSDIHEYIVKFTITEYDNEVTYIERTGYDLPIGDTDTYDVYIWLKQPEVSLEDWSENLYDYMAHTDENGYTIVN